MREAFAEMPKLLQRQVRAALFEVRSSPEHILSHSTRRAVFAAIGPVKVEMAWDWEASMWRWIASQAARVSGWLAVLTARPLLSVWEQNIKPLVDEANKWSLFSYNSPRQVLELAEGLLAGTTDVEHAINEYGSDFRDGYFESSTQEHIYSVTELTSSVLRAVVRGAVPLVSNYPDIALRAYAGIDDNPPGLWYEAMKYEDYLLLDFKIKKWSPERIERLKTYKPFTIDPAKALEFWERYLLELVPQAWRLGQHSPTDGITTLRNFKSL